MQMRYQAALRPDIKDVNITRKFPYFQTLSLYPHLTFNQQHLFICFYRVLFVF